MNQISRTQLKQRLTQSTAKTEWNMKRGFEHKPRSLLHHKLLSSTSLKEGINWQELVYKTFANLMSLCTINSHLGKGLYVCHFPYSPLVYSSKLAELSPVFHTGSLPSVFCIFDCYVKLAFILILMSVFQLL